MVGCGSAWALACGSSATAAANPRIRGNRARTRSPPYRETLRRDSTHAILTHQLIRTISTLFHHLYGQAGPPYAPGRVRGTARPSSRPRSAAVETAQQERGGHRPGPHPAHRVRHLTVGGDHGDPAAGR